VLQDSLRFTLESRPIRIAVTSACARLLAPSFLVDPGDGGLHRGLAHVELLTDRGGVRAVAKQQDVVLARRERVDSALMRASSLPARPLQRKRRGDTAA
jgi:hypothetical protein